MSMKLLPASVNPVDPSPASDVSTSLVPLTQRALAIRSAQITLVPSADAFAWSSPSQSPSATRRGEVNRIYGTLVEDSPNDPPGNGTGRWGWQYVSGGAWGRLVEGAAILHYLSYAASPAIWNGQLIDVYA